MASDSIHVVDPPASIYLRLWLIAIVGLLAPPAVVLYWPDFGWVDQTQCSSGWIRCESLEDAIKLDRRIDDGHPHTGILVLSEGGLAWRSE